MAFGKDKAQLAGTSAFGGGRPSFAQRSAMMMNQQNASRQKRGGGGARFSDIFKPPMQPGSALGRLIPGSYEYTGSDGNKGLTKSELEYWYYIEHFDGRTKRSTICSAGPFHNSKNDRDPCKGCDLHWETREKKNGGKATARVSKRDMYVFNWLYMTPHHKTVQLDDRGQPKLSEKNGEPYYEWVACEGRGCKLCGPSADLVLESADCHMTKWEMGFSHWKTLTQGWNQQIGNSCTGCGGENTIESDAWVCAACGDAIIEMDSTTLSAEDIQKATSDFVVCTNCKEKTFPQEVFHCLACSKPNRASIFDVDMQVARMATGKGDDGQTALMVTRYSAPHPIDQRYADKVKLFDLPRIYTPTPIEYQIKTFDLLDMPQTTGQPAIGQPVTPPVQGGGIQRTPSNSGRTFGRPNFGR